MTGKDIRAERTKRGIAQNTLAEKLGLEGPVISAIENELIEVTPAQLVKIWVTLDSIVPKSSENAA